MKRLTAIAVFVVVGILLGPTQLGVAQTQTSAYCQKSYARARSEASLLFSPRLHVQMLRNPSALDAGPVFANGLQVRLGASFSPVDIWRGARVLSASHADCGLHLAETSARRVISAPADAVLVSAYRAQASVLEQSQHQREELMAQAARRLRENIITVMEFHDLQRQVELLRQKQSDAEGILARLQAEGIEEPPATLSELTERYRAMNETFEQRESDVRVLEPWTFRVTGGVIPVADDTDWYGWFEFSYNFGGFARFGHERRYREARRAELETEEFEVPKRMQVLQKQLAIRVEQARHELETTENQITFVESMLRSLESSQLEKVAHVKDSLVLQQMVSKSERTFLVTLIATLSPLGGN
jgi:hypothetical protein